MANDIFDCAGNASGRQKRGTVVVNAQGPGGGVYKTIDKGTTISNATYTTTWDARFDDPRYYQGDTDA